MWGLGCGREEEPQKNEHFRSYISPIWGERTPGRICTKFCTGGDIQDVITDANSGDDRLSHFSVARGQILGFSIGFRSRPYNTLALPCECVMFAVLIFIHKFVYHRAVLPGVFTRLSHS